ncbi:uncharacterized protein BT62DRAFT_1076352 [Guyanagaster necrorhizus]|uniref:Uncharacterized protein n=1 Tax=Guyanagaster necrorhizus TaxID=856835 RepID=A0A9P8ASA9_9AGAR|nr:uncharacterized protein BT62DRAFT_1076352 [Guyanagaster necrorhizus MCA 3950]KAG7445940.1 hypothetical protein BT62DRAFT_1076352 [Guyanagaster necrorhizus MCA 3950]
MNSQGTTIRWSYFQSALQLAVRRSSRKWTYEDFAECFPTYTTEDKDGSTAIFNQISDYIESQSFRDLDKLFQRLNVQENIDTLHRIVEESKERKQRNIEAKDQWREELEPRAAISARTIPKLEEENIRLREMLSQIEAENSTLTSQLQERAEGTADSEEKALRLLKELDEVLDKWQELPSTELENWTRRMMESTKPAVYP